MFETGPTGRPTKTVIDRNSATCARCGDDVESKHRHDFASCTCRAIFVDGGREYVRHGGDFSVFISTTESHEEEMTNSEISDYHRWGLF